MHYLIIIFMCDGSLLNAIVNTDYDITKVNLPTQNFPRTSKRPTHNQYLVQILVLVAHSCPIKKYQVQLLLPVTPNLNQ